MDSQPGGADLVDMMVILNHSRAPAHISKMEYLHAMKSCGGYEAQLGGNGTEFKIKVNKGLIVTGTSLQPRCSEGGETHRHSGNLPSLLVN